MTTQAIEKPVDTEVTPRERTRNRRTYRPNVDIIEKSDELLLIADMPGTTTENIDVRFENGEMTIFGKVPDRQKEEVRYVSQEYGVGDYLRTFQVSEAIDAEKISAEFTNGVLTLHLPKTDRVKPRKIAIKEG